MYLSQTSGRYIPAPCLFYIQLLRQFLRGSFFGARVCQLCVPVLLGLLIGKLVHKIRHHVQNLGDAVLVLDIDQLGTAILDHQHGAGSDTAAQTPGGIVLLLLDRKSVV